MTTELLRGWRGGEPGLLGDFRAAPRCCEGIAQLSGRHVGITQLWPRGGGIGEAHPPCGPEQTPKSLPPPQGN